MHNKKIGQEGELLAATYLIKEGYTILEKNWRRQFGEIDLIAQKGDELAFVEVKMRKKEYFDLSTVIVPSKQQKLIKTAKAYMATYNIVDKFCRFDVALIQPKDGILTITYIPHAFC